MNNNANTDIIRDYFISQFEKDLEDRGVDTVCFMGYGYNIEDVKVGAEFYFSYLYYGRMASLRGKPVEDCLKAVLGHEKFNGNNKFFDRYKLIQKYKYLDCHIIDHENKTLIPAKRRAEHVRVKNLRTNEITLLHENAVDNANLFCWVEW